MVDITKIANVSSVSKNCLIRKKFLNSHNMEYIFTNGLSLPLVVHVISKQFDRIFLGEFIINIIW